MVTADWYVNHCLPKVFQAWCTRRSRTGVRGLLLHHDNASAHTTAVTLDFLAASDVQLVTHSPYSPDLAPCDWFLFPSVKRHLKGKQFQNAEDARAFFKGVIVDIPQSAWSGVIDSWFERMVKSVWAEGAFFEKLELTEWLYVLLKNQIAKHNEWPSYHLFARNACTQMHADRRLSRAIFAWEKRISVHGCRRKLFHTLQTLLSWSGSVAEMSLLCRRVTRGVEETSGLTEHLIASLVTWAEILLGPFAGYHPSPVNLGGAEKHVACFQDPPGASAPSLAVCVREAKSSSPTGVPGVPPLWRQSSPIPTASLQGFCFCLFGFFFSLSLFSIYVSFRPMSISCATAVVCDAMVSRRHWFLLNCLHRYQTVCTGTSANDNHFHLVSCLPGGGHGTVEPEQGFWCWGYRQQEAVCPQLRVSVWCGPAGPECASLLGKPITGFQCPLKYTDKRCSVWFALSVGAATFV